MEKPPDKKLMSLFFDRKFRNTELTTRYYEGYLWTGFFISEKDNPKQDKLILGRTKDEDLWYSNGLYFFSGPSLLGITWSEFHDFLKDYVNENYPNLKIKRIS